MERRRRTEPPPTPPANPPSPFLRDVSNYKTPKPHSRNPNPNPSPHSIFFTASKKTPTTSSSSSLRRPSISHSKAARRLKALELEQSRSSRKAEIRKEKTLNSFSRSISAWLNSLFRNPSSCGCKAGAWSGDREGGMTANGKRESFDAGEEWRGMKRQKYCSWLGSAAADEASEEVPLPVGSAKLLSLKASLKDVCSFEDLRSRMEGYMSRKSCDEVLLMMSQVFKNIDEGRLKMKAHCPIVTDLALKKKATRVLMCYSPMWLRIGLHIVFGGDSLLNAEKSDERDPFLKMVVENQFFTHMSAARSYAYNKLVEGLYRPGYFEALGNVILKRFLLFVISLDKAKCESMLPIKYGIDGIDGGSPLLFSRNSHIKSSRQAIQEFLLESMHGEGDLLAHLVILGYKVNYQQSPIAEYEFDVKNLFEDLQDGIMLCRAIQLLKSDASILSKVTVPSDTRKKNLQNCSIAMQYLGLAGVPLCDDNGIQIIAEDVVNGDRELTLSVLWNMFVHLQVPLLIDKTSLAKEITRIKGSNVDLPDCNANTEMGLLLTWIQAVCNRQGINAGSFSSIMEGKVLCCLDDYYFKNEIHRCCSSKENLDEHKEFLRHCDTATGDMFCKFASVRSVTRMLGILPELFQLSDILDQDACHDERSVIILLVFLASHLIYQKDLDHLKHTIAFPNYMDSDLMPSPISQSAPFVDSLLSNRKFRGKKVLKFGDPQNKDGLNEDIVGKVRLLQCWWRSLMERNLYLKMKLAACVIQRVVRCHLLRKHFKEIELGRAARLIQSHFRGFTERNRFLKIKTATILLQTAIRAWLTVTSKCKLNTASLAGSGQQSSYGACDGYLRFITERHGFLKMKSSVLVIQHAVRTWVTQRHQRSNNTRLDVTDCSEYIAAATVMRPIFVDQSVWSRGFDLLAVTHKRQAIPQELEASDHFSRAAITIQLAWKSFTKHKLHLLKRCAATKIQSIWRGWYIRKNFLCQVDAIIKIQAGIRCLNYQKAFERHRLAAVEIQRFSRGQLARTWLLGACHLRSDRFRCGSCDVTNTSFIKDSELKVIINSVLKLQGWWKQLLLIRSRISSAILIQSIMRGWSARRIASKKRLSILIIQAHVRGWIARRAAERDRQNIVVIQSYWKGYLARKDSRQQVLDLRRRMEKSAANVDEDMRLINRLVAALSELLGCRSISAIRHTCATLNLATEHSRKCCETLVAAGAIDILLKQFHLLNRGIPDQEVLKHVICILRNIARYPQWLQVLINTPQAVEIIFQELLRNKGEGFFVACELLKRFCTTQEGLEALCSSHGHVRRLNNLVHDLERKAELQKRNVCLDSSKDITTQRLREAANLLLLISNNL